LEIDCLFADFENFTKSKVFQNNPSLRNANARRELQTILQWVVLNWQYKWMRQWLQSADEDNITTAELRGFKNSFNLAKDWAEKALVIYEAKLVEIPQEYDWESYSPYDQKYQKCKFDEALEPNELGHLNKRPARNTRTIVKSKVSTTTQQGSTQGSSGGNHQQTRGGEDANMVDLFGGIIQGP
jgi:hypothetical protein